MGDDSQQAENLAAVRRYCEAWSSANFAAFRDCYHDDFMLHYGGNNPFSGDHAGKARALEVLAEVTRRTRRKLLGIVDVMAGAARATVIVRESFEKNGKRVELERVLVYTVKDGKLHHCWLFDSDQKTVDRFFTDDTPTK